MHFFVPRLLFIVVITKPMSIKFKTYINETADLLHTFCE